MSEESVLIGRETPYIAVVTLNRPQVLNALNRELLQKLSLALNALQKDDSVRVVVFTGAGDKAFCAGADLKERLAMTIDDTRDFLSLIRATFLQIEQMRMPTIAAINGIAFGGGLELALACDLRVMHVEASVGLTECALGILPGAGGTQRLPRLVGIAKAKEMIYLAKRVTASEALATGLVNSISQETDQTLNDAVKLASHIADNAPLSIRESKVAMNASLSLGLDEGLRIEANAYETILASQDRVEGLKAFSEKRRPQFLGR